MNAAEDKNKTEQAQGVARPVADVPTTKPRRKRKYSKNLRDIQKFERNASRALQRVAGSVEAGVREWRKATNRSARRKRDGAIRDALDNYAKATGKQLRVMSRAPADLVRAFRSLRISKIVRRLLPVP